MTRYAVTGQRDLLEQQMKFLKHLIYPCYASKAQGITQIKEQTKTNIGINLLLKISAAAADAARRMHRGELHRSR